MENLISEASKVEAVAEMGNFSYSHKGWINTVHAPDTTMN